ncbi:hypothetical protein GSI_02598 [Ganoderma sinense ZZ0214-1]|uniref:Protein kinase domain-containing protein n=1 Tax=Ganoderma sinense ZZ0214-1 TaxID=1077348 RepID=A0A2G8SM38_9APHY|nr:hypothetical protein GSI_02598 [Ganoderma sinense ZZ0214-1]
MKVLEGPRPAESLAVPAWLADDLELRRRGITLVECLRPPTVFCTSWFATPQHVVKIVEPDANLKLDIDEAAICEFLQRPGARESPDTNHTIPCDVVHAEKTVLVMPYLPSMKAPPTLDPRWLESFLDLAYQLLEGIDYLHRNRIAHMDICPGNLLAATPREADLDDRLAAGTVYIIDFDRALRLAHAPGTQGPILLPSAQFAPPPGVTHLDPYAWDVHCAGRVLETFLAGKARTDEAAAAAAPWVAERLVLWLKGDERLGGFRS